MELETVLDSAIAARAFPGCVLGIVRAGAPPLFIARGRFTYEPDSTLVAPGTAFDLASLTKVLATTAMAMLLHQRGKLRLDQPLVELLPEFSAADALRDRVTLHMLLDHSSGLPAYAPLYQQGRSRDELLKLALTMPLENQPGTAVAYSDIGFILLGEALERLAGEPLNQFCAREIFVPLDMTSITFNPRTSVRLQIPPTENDTSFRHRVIQGEVHDENCYVLGGVAAHAGLFAPAPDIARFAACLLDNGAPLFTSETLATFTTRRSAPRGTSRALGWDTPSYPSQSGKYFSPASFGHLGFTGTSLWIDPVRHLAIILLTNRTWPTRENQLIKRFRPAIHDAVHENI